MIRKFHEAKFGFPPLEGDQGGGHTQKREETTQHAPVTLWGSGTPMREFLHVDDMADAVVYAFENQLPDNLYNIGTGTDLTIKELAEMIQRTVGHTGEVIWDSSKPDGTPRKLMDVSKMTNAGWKAKIGLEEGVRETYQWFLENVEKIKKVKI
jgi:GDP-L-fucose synthase